MSGKQTGGYKDTGLPSLIHQPIGLDRIHQLPRIRRLPVSAFPLTLALYPPSPLHLCSHCQSILLSFCCLFATAPLPSHLLSPPFPSFLPVCNAERWWIDMCRRTEEPIWTGVSAHLYQMLQRYILLLCFITLEWRALKCLTALSSLLRAPPPQPPCPLLPRSPTHLAAVSRGAGAVHWVQALLSSPLCRLVKEHSDASGAGYRFHCMAEALTKPLPCLPILMTTSCHTGPPLAEPGRCLCQSRLHRQPLFLSMTSGWHHWKGIKVIKRLVVHYCKGQCNIKTHRSARTESKLRCFTLSWMRGQLSASSLSGRNFSLTVYQFCHNILCISAPHTLSVSLRLNVCADESISPCRKWGSIVNPPELRVFLQRGRDSKPNQWGAQTASRTWWKFGVMGIRPCLSYSSHCPVSKNTGALSVQMSCFYKWSF